tara:strand:+ start:387 stop:1085 length:699 start_codon:yes stop_codon:yes gene_type:complete
MKKEIWAIIPARAGSKGIKSKNSKDLGKLPLIVHTIKSLQKSKCFDKIIVSTDSNKIIKIAKEYSIMHHKRTDPKHSNDITMPDIPTIEVLKNTREANLPEFIFMTSCTSPFIKHTTYIRALDILKKNPEATVFAAHQSHYFLWQENKKEKNKKNFLPIAHSFKKRLGRQYIDKQINETGAFYGFKTKNFIKAKHRFFSEAYPCYLKGQEIIDLNDSNDWKYAEYIINKHDN